MRGVKSKSGFTLIELLVVLALTSVISIGMLYYMQLSVKLITKAVDNAKAMQSVRSIARRITDDVMQSSGASQGSGQKKLILGGIQYEFIDRKVRRREESDIYFMTTENEIKDINFSYHSTKYISIDIIPSIGEEQSITVYARN